ncbi:MAG: hypothetical protein AAGF11_32685 [Myxococcota bacterium]
MISASFISSPLSTLVTLSLVASPVALLVGCTDRPAEDGTQTDTDDTTGTPGTTTATTTTPPPPPPPATTTGTDTTTTGPALTTSSTTTGPDPDSGSSSEGSSSGSTGTGSTGTTGALDCTKGDPGCNQLDLVFVIDNSGTMGEEQLTLARSFPLFVEQLRNLTDAAGAPIDLDVQVMVTTTDFGNPLCTQFEPPGYDPAEGMPISTPCTDRLADFDNLVGTVSIPEACTNLCPAGIAPTDDYVAFDANGSNVPGAPVDIDGDGTPDSPAAQALACIGPQGINGCGYESPLENMLRALDPSAPWNQGPAPFLRDGATLGLVLVSDEADCSIQDYTILEDPAYQNVNPNTGVPAASSAICWNAGVTCNGPDAMGVFSSCTTSASPELQPLTRYTDYLIQELRDNQGKEVFMVAITGVPEVTARSLDLPYAPTAGGVFDLVYRLWQDGPYPAGDILPDEWAMGETAADKQFDFGIGPGCTGQDGMGNFTGQAIPPVRMLEVCETLNLDATLEGTRCCVESICDADYSGAVGCLAGMAALTAG